MHDARGRENLDQNAVNFLQYEEESSAPERERAEELYGPDGSSAGSP